jgi:hypothetical protein
MDKLLILNEIQKYYGFKKDSDFAKYLGVNAQTYYKWKSRNTFDVEVLHTKCPQINPTWILTGQGDMLLDVALDNLVPLTAEKIKYLEEINELLRDKINNLEKQLDEFLNQK